MEKYIYNKESLPTPVYDSELLSLYDYAWQTAFNKIEYVQKDGWKPILTCMPKVGTTWQWDSCFLTFFTNYSNGTLSALNNLDNFYRLQRDDGFISMAYRIETDKEAFGERINPPLYAWAEWDYYTISGDSSRFDRVLPAIEGFYSFIENNRSRPCGLYYFEDTGSSGMDNSPRSGYSAYDLKGSDVCFVDLACQQSLTALCMSKMYTLLKNTEKSEFYKQENKRINELINKYHYSEKTGFYYDFFARNSKNLRVKFINTKTAAAFWTLVCGAATGDRLRRVVEHIMSPDEFYTPTPFASLSKDDLNYDKTGGYWLGSAWHPTNFVAIRGLYQNGYKKEAHDASLKFLEVIKNTGGIWECYSPEENAPAKREDGSTVRADFVGWGGLFPITVLIENIIGLHFDANSKTVTFDIYDDKKRGIENMKFCGKKLSIIYENKKIHINTTTPFTLEICDQKIDIPIGTSVIDI